MNRLALGRARRIYIAEQARILAGLPANSERLAHARTLLARGGYTPRMLASLAAQARSTLA